MITQRSVSIPANVRTAVSTVVNLCIINPETNTDPVYVGDIGVTTSIGMPIQPGEGFSYEFVPTQPPAPTYVITPTPQQIILVETVYEPTTQQRTPEQFNLVITSGGNGGGGPDIIPPFPINAVYSVPTLTLTFSEAIVALTAPDLATLADNFIVTGADSGTHVVSAVTQPTSTGVALTVATSPFRHEAVTVSFTKPGVGEAQLADAANNQVQSFVASVINNATQAPPDTAVPTPLTAAVNTAGTTLTIDFTENLGTTPPATSAFAVTGAGSGSHVVSGVTIATNRVTLTLALTVLAGENIEVVYTKPGAAPWIADLAGNAVATFTIAADNHKTGSFPSGAFTLAEGIDITSLNASADAGGGRNLGMLWVGTWPNLHGEMVKWVSTISPHGAWVGVNEQKLAWQSDPVAMDLGNKSGADLVQFTPVSNPNPWQQPVAILDPAFSPQSASGGTIHVLAVGGHGKQFTSVGVIRIRDNLIQYTGISGVQTSPFSFTGCTLLAGSGGSMPSNVYATQDDSGGWGYQACVLPYAGPLWAAGMRLQERQTAHINADPSGTHRLLAAVYWYQNSNGMGSYDPGITSAPSGGIGFSGTLSGTLQAGGTRGSERAFTECVNDWADWAGSGTPSKVITLDYIYPRLCCMMETGATETGEVLNYVHWLRWVWIAP